MINRSMCGCVAAVTAVVMMSARSLSAQIGTIDLFQSTKSYAGLGTPDVVGKPPYYAANAEPKLLAEAQMFATFPLLRGPNFQDMRDGFSGVRFNLYLSTQFRLRALDVQSGPVRSISFMPRFIGQWLWSPVPDSDRRTIQSVSLILGHHSNGGDGCVFADETADADGNCVSALPPGTPASQREAKVRNGNFSTNYVELGWSMRTGEYLASPAHHWKWAVDPSIGVQVHHNVVGFPLPGGAVRAFRDLYGPIRPHVEVNAHYLFGKRIALRGRFRQERIFPKESRFPGSSNWIGDYELLIQRPVDAYQSSRLYQRIIGILAPGVRHARGQDYYNTQFVRDISLWQFVLAVDPWSPWHRR